MPWQGGGAGFRRGAKVTPLGGEGRRGVLAAKAAAQRARRPASNDGSRSWFVRAAGRQEDHVMGGWQASCSRPRLQGSEAFGSWSRRIAPCASKASRSAGGSPSCA
jgi:hypothetical protein